MTVAHLHRPGELTGDRVDRWRELVADAAEPNPFFEPEFLLPAWRLLRPRGAALLTVEEDGDWIACLPVRRLPGGAGWSTWMHEYCFLGTPLVRRERVEPALSALLAPVAQRPGRPLLLRFIDDDGPIRGGLVAARARHGVVSVWERRFDRAFLDRSADHRGPSAKTRSTARRAMRKLEEALGEPLAVRDEAGSDAAVERFLRLEASGWKGQAGTALISNGAHAQLYRTVVASFARSGRLQLVSLGGEDRTVAMATQLISGDGVFGFKHCFDERYRAQSPGTLLAGRVVEAFDEHGPQRFFDSCSAQDDALSGRLLPHRRALTSVVVMRRGVAADAARVAIRGGLAAGARRG